jgi:hypothetical protein
MAEDDTLQQKEIIKQWVAKRDKALIELNIDWFRKQHPLVGAIASSDEVLLISMHKARYQIPTIPTRLRHASGDWLRERGYGITKDIPLLPPGRLPK